MESIEANQTEKVVTHLHTWLFEIEGSCRKYKHPITRMDNSVLAGVGENIRHLVPFRAHVFIQEKSTEQPHGKDILPSQMFKQAPVTNTRQLVIQNCKQVSKKER